MSGHARLVLLAGLLAACAGAVAEAPPPTSVSNGNRHAGDTAGTTSAAGHSTAASTDAAATDAREAAAADARAAAMFARLAPTEAELASLRLPASGTTDLDTFVVGFSAAAEHASSIARTLAARLEPVLGQGSARWVIAARVRQAEVYEALGAAIADAITPQSLTALAPRDAHGPLPMTPELRATLAARLAAAMRPTLDSIECLAFVHYALAAGAARTAEISSPESDRATERLSQYPAGTSPRCVP